MTTEQDGPTYLAMVHLASEEGEQRGTSVLDVNVDPTKMKVSREA